MTPQIEIPLQEAVEQTDMGQVKDIQSQLRRLFSGYERNLEIVFVNHNSKNYADNAAVLAEQMASHPMGHHIKQLLKSRSRQSDKALRSSFIGMAMMPQSSMAGFLTSTRYLAVINVNVEQYETLEECTQDLTRACWNICDIIAGHRDPEQGHKARSGLIVPKLELVGQLLANLKADIFSAVIEALQSGRSVDKYARVRAFETLSVNRHKVPENYPFLVGYDKVRFLLKEREGKKTVFSKLAHTAWEMAELVGESTQRDMLKEWWRFARASQDMAWRGFEPERILLAAIDKNENLEMRKFGVLLADLAGVADELDNQDITGLYNPFATNAFNARLHTEQIEDIFENEITRCVFENSSAPLLKKADQQNHALINGRILGWCAIALQEAAAAYDKANQAGQSPVQAARVLFDQFKSKVNWEAMRSLGDEIINTKRMGHDIEFQGLVHMVSRKPALGPLMNSITITARREALKPRKGFVTPGGGKKTDETSATDMAGQESSKRAAALPQEAANAS